MNGRIPDNSEIGELEGISWPSDEVSKFIPVGVAQYLKAMDEYRGKLSVTVNQVCSYGSGKICVCGVARVASISAGLDVSCICGNFDVIRIGSAQGDMTQLMRYAMLSAVR